MNDFGYYKAIIENLEKVNATQSENIRKAAELMTDAIANDRLINVYGVGGRFCRIQAEILRCHG